MTDAAELVRKAQTGEPRAFGEIVAQYQGRIFGLAVRLTGDRTAAMDLTQETFLRAYEALARFEGRSSVGTWLSHGRVVNHRALA